MRNNILPFSFILFAVFTFSSVTAVFGQTGGTYKIEQSVVAGGGGTSSSSAGNIFSVTGTTGQSAAGVLSSGGAFSLEGGFWTSTVNGGAAITISGQITFNSNPLENVIVSLSGSAMNSTTTDSAGNFLFSNLTSGGNYTVTPALSNYAFTPTSYTFTNPTTNQTANFTGAQCSISIEPNGTFATAQGGNGSVTVTALTGCTWTAATNDNWITVQAGTTGSGTGTVNYSIAGNTGAQRTGSIQIAGQNFIITQTGTIASISGTIIYGTSPANQSKFVSDVTMSAAGVPSATAATNSAGAYLLENLTTGGNYTVTASKTGNVNGISPFDATMVLRHVAANGTGPNALNANQQIAADTNGNGSISPFDATLILRYVAAGASNANTGQVGNWKFTPASRPYQLQAGNLSGENYTASLIGEVNGNWMAGGSLAGEISAPADIQQDSAATLVKAEDLSVIIPTPGIALIQDWQVELNDEIETAEKTIEVFAETQQAGEIQLSLPENVAAKPGEILTIPVMLDNSYTGGISSYNFAIRFDPSILHPEISAIETADSLSSNGFAIIADTNTQGRIGIAASASGNVAVKSGVLLYLRFKVRSLIGDSSKAAIAPVLNFETTKKRSIGSKFEDEFGNRISLVLVNGSLLIAAGKSKE